MTETEKKSKRIGGFSIFFIIAVGILGYTYSAFVADHHRIGGGTIFFGIPALFVSLYLFYVSFTFLRK